MFEDEEFLNAVQKCMDESTCTAAEVADESRMSSHSRKKQAFTSRTRQIKEKVERQNIRF
ncbi:hypothetical protein [Methanosarcina horonobensis]|nr:hypothetical protein [Methanosarcina horonobensis]